MLAESVESVDVVSEEVGGVGSVVIVGGMGDTMSVEGVSQDSQEYDGGVCHDMGGDTVASVSRYYGMTHLCQCVTHQPGIFSLSNF